MTVGSLDDEGRENPCSFGEETAFGSSLAEVVALAPVAALPKGALVIAQMLSGFPVVILSWDDLTASSPGE
jgi:hypothetical protein